MIEEVCATGLKLYLYKTNVYTVKNDKCEITEKRDVIVHAKGFSLKGDAHKQITCDSISSCIKNSKKVITVTYKYNITCDNHQNIFVKDKVKKFKFTFDKHIVLSDFFTIPYGYCAGEAD